MNPLELKTRYNLDDTTIEQIISPNLFAVEKGIKNLNITEHLDVLINLYEKHSEPMIRMKIIHMMKDDEDSQPFLANAIATPSNSPMVNAQVWNSLNSTGLAMTMMSTENKGIRDKALKLLGKLNRIDAVPKIVEKTEEEVAKSTTPTHKKTKRKEVL